MSNELAEILDAAEKHLLVLKAKGVSWVPADPGQFEPMPRAGSPSAAAVAVNTPEAANLVESQTSPSPSGLDSGSGRTAPRAVPASMRLETTSPLPSPTTGSKLERMEALRERAVVCEKCPHLVVTRTQVVFGVGDINSPLMFVGEAPGADEDAQGEPFVGAAGQLLTRIIKAMGFDRETVYIANVLKCRPDMPAGSSGNRKPTPVEMKTCLPYLLEQIAIIQPKVVVALGATALEGLTGRAEPISKARGRFQSVNGAPMMPTFHPSFLLRNQAMSAKRQVWEDMLQVLEKLEMPISEKQRGYFLRA